MKMHAKTLISSVFLGLLCVWTPGFAQEAPDPMALEQERRIKEDSERQAQIICDSIFGKGRSSVLANVELGLESVRKGGGALSRKLDARGGPLHGESYLLPWVPAPKSVTKEETPKDASVETQAAQQATVDVRTIIRRFDITVVHDEALPAASVAAAEETLRSAFSRYRDVLKIFFRPTVFDAGTGFNPREVVTRNLWDFFKPQYILLALFFILAYMLLRFFFGPLADFMRSYIDGMRQQARSKVEMESHAATENETEGKNEEEENLQAQEGELTPEEQAALEEEEAMKKFEPFKYVTDENVKQLAYLLHHEEPWVIAVVISYLTPEHATKAMEALPADLQARVALETAMFRQTSHEQVVAIDEDIKEKINFVVGGLEKLVHMLENSDRFARDNILEFLKNEKPAIYQRVREQIFLFEDIVSMQKPTMQAIVRELKTEQLAKALRNVSPELQQKFMDNMSQGAVTLLKEEIEYGRQVTHEQIEEERRKIVDMIKAMEAEGKIAFRQRGKTTALDAEEMGADLHGLSAGLSARDRANPAEAARLIEAGSAAAAEGRWEEAIGQLEMAVQADPGSAEGYQALGGAYYSLGRYAEALNAYETVLQLAPSEALRTWIEEFRANLATQAS